MFSQRQVSVLEGIASEWEILGDVVLGIKVI
jgi:hypothetical protein